MGNTRLAMLCGARRRCAAVEKREHPSAFHTEDARSRVT